MMDELGWKPLHEGRQEQVSLKILSKCINIPTLDRQKTAVIEISTSPIARH